MPVRVGNSALGVTAPLAQDLLQPLRRDRDLRYRARHADGVIDGRRDRGADARDAALASTLDAERSSTSGMGVSCMAGKR